MTVDGVEYDTLADAINAASDHAILSLGKDFSETVNIPTGKSFTVYGNGNKLIGQVNLESSDAGLSDIKFNNVVFDGQSTSNFAINSANQTSDAGKSSAIIELSNCTVSGYTGKGLYLTNVKSLNLTNCTFKDNATADMGEPNTVGDYVVDLNLIGVSDVNITLNGCIFENNGAKKAIVKVAQRGGPSDADASDIPKDVGVASIKSMIIEGCSFVNTAEGVSDINIGTTSKSGKDAINVSGNYPVKFINNLTDVSVNHPYDGFEITVPALSIMQKFTLTHVGKVVTVFSEEDLSQCLSDDTVSQVIFNNSLELSEQHQISHPIDVKTNGKVINTAITGKILFATANSSYQNIIIGNSGDTVDWSSTYALQCYTGQHIINNAKLYGCNAGLLVNGSTVKLFGTIDVSNNTFGGIEVSKGSAPGLAPSKLDITNAKLVNQTESYGKPTIWIDGEDSSIGEVIGGDNLTVITKDGQKQYYIKAENSVPSN